VDKKKAAQPADSGETVKQAVPLFGSRGLCVIASGIAVWQRDAARELN